MHRKVSLRENSHEIIIIFLGDNFYHARFIGFYL
jgi:hypothetical protein